MLTVKQFFLAVVSKLRSLHVIFILLFTVLLSITSWLIWNQLDYHVRSDLMQQYKSIVNTTAEQAAQTAKPLIQANDRLSLQVYAKESIEKRQLDSITFYGPSQEILAYANRKGAAKITQRVTSSNQITSNNTTIGSVMVVLSTEPIERMLDETTGQIILIACAVWVLGAILLRSLFHFYDLKISALAHRIKRPQKDNPFSSGFNELHPLESELKNFEKKAIDKSELDNNLNQLLNQQALHQASKESDQKELSIQPRHASVLYVKAIGLDNINQELPKKDAAQLISEYVTLVQQAAKLYNGFVQVQANGLTIIFGAPQKMNEHCLHAICAATFLYRLLNQHHSKKSVHKSTTLKFQIAIHTGDVFCFNTPEQASMAIFGEVIFTSAQLASQANPGQILLSEDARKEPELENKVTCKGPYNLGSQMGSVAYQVSHLADNYEKLIERQVKHISSLRQPA